ncbi:MAG: hypothetical protein AAGA66_01275 [Bacteroidota bacterium]
MKNSVFLFLLLFTFGMYQANAHDPLTSKIELHGTYDQGAVLRIFLTQVQVHRTLESEHPYASFDDKKMYEQMVISYLKDHINIKADDVILQLNSGAIKLGSHETLVVFDIKNYPERVKKLDVTIDAFEQSGQQQTVFWWYTPSEKSKFVLSHRNNFQAFFEIGKKPYANQLPKAYSGFFDTKSIVLLFTAILCVLCFVFLYVSKVRMKPLMR